MWFIKKRHRPGTIGLLKDQGRRMAVWCGACKTMTYEASEDLPYVDTMQLAELARVYACPECGFCNSNGKQKFKLTISGEGH